MSVSPLDSNVLTSPTVEFTLQNGQKVEMTVDIDLEGNTGEPKFEMQVPDVWAIYHRQMQVSCLRQEV